MQILHRWGRRGRGCDKRGSDKEGKGRTRRELGNWKKNQKKLRGREDFQKQKKRNICSAGAESISFWSLDSCLLCCEGHILSSYVHMCVSHVPFLALMLFLINSALFFSQAQRQSQDNETLSQAVFAGGVELFFWWMSDLVTDAICQLFVCREFNRFHNKFLHSCYYFSACTDNSAFHYLQSDSTLVLTKLNERLNVFLIWARQQLGLGTHFSYFWL